MTVRVISEKPVRTRRVVCENCCYELEFTPADIESQTYRDYDGTSDTDYFIVCAQCRKRVTVRRYES